MKIFSMTINFNIITQHVKTNLPQNAVEGKNLKKQNECLSILKIEQYFS